jgi:hypothetical protein
MQTKTHWQLAVDDHSNARTGGAHDAAESRNQSDPMMTNPQMDALLGVADDQTRQFARYAAREAVQDGVFEQD